MTLTDWLGKFELDPFLHLHATAVLEALPLDIRDGLIADPTFRIVDCAGTRGQTYFVSLAVPVQGKPSRSIVLKRTLKSRPVEFVRYVIAHELAHAHLNNQGRFPGEDPETAADALAADWGFPRPLAG